MPHLSGSIPKMPYLSGSIPKMPHLSGSIPQLWDARSGCFVQQKNHNIGPQVITSVAFTEAPATITVSVSDGLADRAPDLDR
jgi:hypothetical protein